MISYKFVGIKFCSIFLILVVGTCGLAERVYAGTPQYVHDESPVLKKKLTFGGLAHTRHSFDTAVAIHQRSVVLVLGEVEVNESGEFGANYKESFQNLKARIHQTHRLYLVTNRGSVFTTNLIDRSYNEDLWEPTCCIFLYAKMPESKYIDNIQYGIFSPYDTRPKFIELTAKSPPEAITKHLTKVVKERTNREVVRKTSKRVGQNERKSRWFIKVEVKADTPYQGHRFVKLPFVVDYSDDQDRQIDILFSDIESVKKPNAYNLSTFVDRDRDGLADSWFSSTGGPGPYQSWRPKVGESVLIIRENKVVAIDGRAKGI